MRQRSRTTKMMNFDAVYAILRRNVQSYFSGVLGYLVIVLFVTVAAFCAFSPKFFAYNLANLDQLSEVFPILLLALVPAITMSAWADERKLGTDEILFTLPATDLEILLGKYLAVLSVYTIALAFSVTQLFVLAWIGDPDWGVVFTTYLGYWLAGAALLSAGMFASVLTGSTTVAYVMGATLCAIPVFIGSVAPGNAFVQSLSLNAQLREFTSGMIPLSGLMYFAALTVFMLYLNMIVITSRHWRSGQEAAMGAHFGVRVVFLAAALISMNFIADRSAASFLTRIDLTSEGLYTLSKTTRDVLGEARDEDRPVTIQAFISPEVPQAYAYARKQLVGLLRQYSRLGDNMVDVRFVDVKPNSSAAKEARTLGVEPQRHRAEVGGKEVEEDVYLGAVITGNYGEVVVPFLDGVTSMEYQMTQAINTVTTREERLRVGILATDALRLNEESGQPGVSSFFSRSLEALERQYKVVPVSTADLAELVSRQEDATDTDGEKQEGEDSAEERDEAIEAPDVLMVVQPSSLTQQAMNNLVAYVNSGKPVLLFDDPLPFFPYVFYRPEDLGVVNAPLQSRPTPDSALAWVSSVEQLPVPPDVQMQLMQMQQQLSQVPPQFAQRMMQEFFANNPQARPKFEGKADGGTASSLMGALGLEWNPGEVAWDLFNPHPDASPFWVREVFGDDWPKSYGAQETAFVYVAPENGAAEPFGQSDPISKGLQELLFCYPGSINWKDREGLEVTALVTTGTRSGLIPWDKLTYTETVFQEQVDPATQRIVRVPREVESPLSSLPLRRLEPRPATTIDDSIHVLAVHVHKQVNDDVNTNVVFVSDFDCLSDFYFEQQESLDKPFDNMTFVFNALESLAGDDSLVSLRNRRAKPRRLMAIQGEKDAFRQIRSEEQRAAEKEIREKLTTARAELDKKQQEISEDTELGFIQKFGQLGQAADVAQREFDLQRRELEDELQQTIEDLKATEQQRVDRLESTVRMAAVLLPPVPALLLGLVVLFVRVMNEGSRVKASRRRT